MAEDETFQNDVLQTMNAILGKLDQMLAAQVLILANSLETKRRQEGGTLNERWDELAIREIKALEKKMPDFLF